MRVSASLLAAVFGILLSSAAQAAEPTLTVYTYDSFISEWGPGPAIQKQFEAQCHCKLTWVGLEDGAALLSRLKMEGKKTKADVVLGLDTNLTSEAAATGFFAPAKVDVSKLKLPVAWNDKTFVPYDYGYFAFVYDSQKLPNPPKSLAELTAPGDQPKILLMDPRTSTPGLGLLLWMKEVYGDKATEAWAKVAPKVLTISKGWSEAYGLFVKGEAPMVLSYTTSPAYHQINEKTDRYKALDFPEGNYLQVEVAARMASSKHADLAEQFLAFLTSPEVQKLIPTTNYMFPVVDIGNDLPAEFRNIPQPQKTLLMPSDEVAKHRHAWIREWLETVSR
ncbi:thiamine ABC transporter substrate binding subunit [Dongia soli]|uniref:Thiamine ABC transporter substrate binding subunit n=1 Tax=Dongia soli TaxID=600628 RepID=A0ABU5EHZ0_9PROT|nr:thiamine ABC transporter substrate binding subunit [Dongia soli]MDY0885048.1 thiamine ABC transporter substrate binding subunit [Dongia soli]